MPEKMCLGHSMPNAKIELAKEKVVVAELSGADIYSGTGKQMHWEDDEKSCRLSRKNLIDTRG